MAIHKFLRYKPGALYLVTADGERKRFPGSQLQMNDAAKSLRGQGYTGVPHDRETFTPDQLLPMQFTRIPEFRDHWEHSCEWKTEEEPTLL